MKEKLEALFNYRHQVLLYLDGKLDWQEFWKKYPEIMAPFDPLDWALEGMTNNQQKEVQKGSPNSTTIYKVENNLLKEENISSESLNPLIEKVYKEVNPIIILIYSSVAYNRTMKIDDLFNQFVEIFKSNNIQKLFSQESFIEGPNKVLSSLSYNKNRKPDWGVKITETNKVFSIEFYEEGKITFTKKVNSLDQVQETINSLYKKYEEE